MKKLLLPFLGIALFLASCSKGGDSSKPTETGNGTTPQTVSIGGTSYTTVKIGSQTWTSVNYNGAGGQNYTSTNDPVYGKLYSVAESKAIALPAGWRLPTKSDFENLVKNYAYKIDAVGDYNILPEGTKKLKSTTGWSIMIGDNTSGFNAVAAGIGVIPTSKLGQFQDKGLDAWFISSTDLPPNSATGVTYTPTYCMHITCESYKSGTQTLTDDRGDVAFLLFSSDYRYSIRIVKDN